MGKTFIEMSEDESSNVGNPQADYLRVYSTDYGGTTALAVLDSNGNEVVLISGGGIGVTDHSALSGVTTSQHHTATVDTDTNIYPFVNGIFEQAFNALVTSDGATVTMSLEKAGGGGDLTMRFSDGPTTLDCTPTLTTVLTAGSNTSPTENYVYVTKSAKVLAVSTSDWPAIEHNRVAYVLTPSPSFVASFGPYINQNWNDFLAGPDNQGHLTHITQRLRYSSALYHSGINGNGDGGTYIERTDAAPDTVYIKITAGVILQMHRHASPAVDTSGTDYFLVYNSSVGAYESGQDLYDFLVDADGDSMANKYYNLVLWSVANKTGEFEPTMINLPTCSYNKPESAQEDRYGCDVFSFPPEYNLESSSGHLIARLTMKHSNGGQDLELISTVDLRRQSPGTITGGNAPGVVESFPDNQFEVYDESDVTKVLEFDVGENVPTGTTITLTVPATSGTVVIIADIVPLAPSEIAADPCGTYPEGSIFYNDTSNYMCYCDGTDDVKMHDPTAACF